MVTLDEEEWVQESIKEIIETIFKPLRETILKQVDTIHAQHCFMIGGSCLLQLVQAGWNEVFPNVQVFERLYYL